MDIVAWMKSFRELHERARKSQLEPEERREYMAAREQLARSLVAAQGLGMVNGQSARRTFRVAQALPVDINLSSGTVRVLTQDLSMGGFACLMHRPPDEKEEPGFSMRMPRGGEPLVGRARVVSVVRRIGNVRVSFAFHELAEHERERLEMLLFDLALERIPT